MNNHSFTEDQLLQLINSTIDDSGYKSDDFTGGNIQVTSTYKNKVISYKIMLFFGYDKNKNSISYSEDIDEDHYFLWGEAILLKVHSIKAKKTGSGLSKINERMNRNNKVRNDSSNTVSTTSTLPLPNTSIPNTSTSLPIRVPKKFKYPEEFENIWHWNRKGDKWKAYRAYFGIKADYSFKTLQKALQVEALKQYGRRDTSTVFNGDINDLLLQEQSIRQQTAHKNKDEPQVGSLEWDRQQQIKQQEGEIDAELI